ncbi:MAG TPA: hypothetical protein ACFYD1_05800 [Candidatus Hypogeohydataceae bacterium YC38]
MLKNLYEILKSKKLGIGAGFTATGLLIFGSLLMNFMPQPYQGLSGEDITFFFKNPKLLHGWFYLLFATLVLYGLNSFFCTLDSVLVRLRRGASTRGALSALTLYGGSVIHVAFMVTLLAHLVGGLYTRQGRPITIDENPIRYGDVEIRLTDLETTQYPNGMPREVRASLRLKKGDVEIKKTLGYNQPLLLDLGAKEFLLKDYGSVPQEVVLRVGDKAHSLKLRESFSLNGSQVVLAGLFLPPEFEMPAVGLVANHADRKPEQFLVPIGEGNSREVNGARVVFEDLKVSQAVVVDLRENPSVPLAFGAVLLFCVGVAMVIMRLVYKLAHS